MAPSRSDLSAAHIIFYVTAIVGTAYGLGFLLWPQIVFSLVKTRGCRLISAGCARPGVLS
jgi:hypothetical protein